MELFKPHRKLFPLEIRAGATHLHARIGSRAPVPAQLPLDTRSHSTDKVQAHAEDF
jgi:hypothetical protein